MTTMHERPAAGVDAWLRWLDAPAHPVGAATIRYGLDSRLRDVIEGCEPPSSNAYYDSALFDSFTSDVAPAVRSMGVDR